MEQAFNTFNRVYLDEHECQHIVKTGIQMGDIFGFEEYDQPLFNVNGKQILLVHFYDRDSICIVHSFNSFLTKMNNFKRSENTIRPISN